MPDNERRDISFTRTRENGKIQKQVVNVLFFIVLALIGILVLYLLLMDEQPRKSSSRFVPQRKATSEKVAFVEHTGRVDPDDGHSGRFYKR